MTSVCTIISLCSLLTLTTAHPTAEYHQRHSIAVRPRANSYDATSELYANWPSYADLPLNASYPTKAAWGVWGTDDVHGALNHITNSTKLAAKEDLQLGRSFNLNLPLAEPMIPINPDRKPLQHLFQPSTGYTDDVVVMNTQISTQIDGLRHFPYSTNNSVDSYQWYNNLIPSYEDVIGPAPSTVLGLQQAANKAIVARGVLLDFAGWASAHNLTYDALHTNYSITVAQLNEVPAWQNIPSDWARPGDILLIRTGWLKQYLALDTYDQQIHPYSKEGPSGGMLASDEMLEWLWDKRLAMVGVDNPAFESTPFDKEIDGVARSLHHVFIGGWGMSILEFLDLEALTLALHEIGRWSFFLTVCPLNIGSGIASPPNAIAII